MKDTELDVLINTLETRNDLTVADFDGVVHALGFLIPGKVSDAVTPQSLCTTDGAMLVADDSFPNWAVSIHGRANDQDGHWRCTLRESDVRDNDEAIGRGRSPVLAQAVLAAILRLSIILSKQRETA